MRASVRNVVLVCGGRNFDDWLWLARELRAAKPTKITNGAQRGADKMSTAWAIAHDVPFQEYEPDTRNFGKAAFPMRNTQMLKAEVPDTVIGFPGGRGTDDMVRKAYAEQKHRALRIIDLRNVKT